MNFKDHYRTIIVGAGPAGVMAALHAGEHGDVLLVDSSELPRDKSCGGMLNEYSQHFLSAYASLPSNIFEDPEWVRFRYFDWDRDLRRETTLRFANINRKGFDEWLLGLLPSKGMTIAGGIRFTGCQQDSQGVSATLRVRDPSVGITEDVTVHCDYLIGCDGPRSQVRRSLPVRQLALYKTLQDFLPLQDPMDPFFDCVYARNVGPDYGYGYLIPKGNEAIIGSVFFPQSKNCLVQHEKAVDLYRGFYPYGTELRKREAWTAVQVRSGEDIVAGYGRVLLAGEAAGIMSPSSGEGISFALNSGKLAGMSLRHGKDPDSVAGGESEALRAYQETLAAIRKNIERRLRFFPIMNSSWGKWIGGCLPTGIIDRFTHMI